MVELPRPAPVVVFACPQHGKVVKVATWNPPKVNATAEAMASVRAAETRYQSRQGGSNRVPARLPSRRACGAQSASSDGTARRGIWRQKKRGQSQCCARVVCQQASKRSGDAFATAGVCIWLPCCKRRGAAKLMGPLLISSVAAAARTRLLSLHLQQHIPPRAAPFAG